MEALVPVTVVEGRRITLTNLDRVLFPATGTPKAAVVGYYAAVAPLMVPHLADRPLTLVRFPEGVEGERWVAKTPPPGKPPWVGTVAVPRSEGAARQLMIDSAAALVWAANLSGEFHTVQWRASTPRVADRLVVDIDPGPGADLLACRDAALVVRERLAADGLTAYVKVSGSKGLHLLVGLEPTPSEQVSAYARALAQDLERAQPDRFTAVMAKARRQGRRQLLDWSQNNAAKTTASPYTLRAGPRPLVSAPMSWTELEHATRVEDLQITLEEMVERIPEGDLLAALLDPGQAQRLPAPALPSSPPAPGAGRRATRVPATPSAAGATGLRLDPPLEIVRPQKAGAVPSERALRGGTRYEVKLDGFRILGIRPDRETPAVLQTRAGRNVARDFPTVERAVAELPPGTIVDGELVAWRGGALTFEDLLRTRSAREKLGCALGYVVFDVLVDRGDDIRSLPLRDRLVRLEALLREVGLPLQPVMATTSRPEAMQWIGQFASQGIEGLVCKGLGTGYDPHGAGWVKYRPQDTADATVLAVSGTAARPQALLLQLGDGSRIWSSPALDAVRARSLAAKLTGLLGPAEHHPDAGTLLPLTEPLLAEIRLGTGRHRTAAFVRLRAAE